MVTQISIVGKESHKEAVANMGGSNKVQLSKENPSVVKLQLNKDDVKSFSKEGNDLKVILNNGRTQKKINFKNSYLANYCLARYFCYCLNNYW